MRHDTICAHFDAARTALKRRDYIAADLAMRAAFSDPDASLETACLAGKEIGLLIANAREEDRKSKRLADGPAKALGIVERIIITDGDDCVNFEWKRGQGVTFK
jgi:hypothetical protein